MARGNNVLEIIINGTNRAGPAFKQAAVQATRMGIAVGLAFTAATIRAGKFEKGLAEISTLLDGDVTQSIRQIRGELLDLSTEFGQSIGKMTKARYDIISAGFTNAAESAEVLRAASKLAVAGVSDVATASDLLTSALGGLQLKANESERVINVLFQTVRKGKTTLSELGRGFGRVFGTAKIAKVSIEELGAAMATATASGVNTAESITGLNALLLALSAPTEEARKALEDAGISMDKGFLQALIAVNKAAGESPAKLRELIPSIEALRVASVIAGNLELMTKNLESMADSAGVVDEAFAQMAATFDFKMNQAGRALDALVITIGDSLLPAFTNIVEKITETATLMRFLGESVEYGIPRWKVYAETLKNEVVAAFNEIGGVVGFVRDRLTEMTDALDAREFNRRVTEVMRALMELEDTPFKMDDLFGKDVWDLKALRDYAEMIVRARDAAGEGDEPADNFFTHMSDVVKGLIADLARVKKAQEDAIELARLAKIPLGYIPPEPFEGKDVSPVTQEMSDDTKKRIEDIKEQVASLAQFTAEDFIGMAFNIGSAFANVATQIAAHLFGLTKGPLMLGRAFKQMAISILSDLAQIIARMMVARALMSAFGGGGLLGGAFKALGGFNTGGTVPTAAAGYSVPGGTGQFFPPIILPGSSGLDRRPVLAAGGEVIISKPHVNAMQAAIKQPMTSPRRETRAGRRGMKVQIDLQANRPFNRQEQVQLTDSVTESFDRSARYGS